MKWRVAVHHTITYLAKRSCTRHQYCEYWSLSEYYPGSGNILQFRQLSGISGRLPELTNFNTPSIYGRLPKLSNFNDPGISGRLPELSNFDNPGIFGISGRLPKSAENARNRDSRYFRQFWIQFIWGLFRCKIATLNFSMGFNIVAPYMVSATPE